MDVLDAAGFEVILIETVGVGQDEVDIVKAAETTAVVLVPGLGDDIQAIKAGILEIADVFIVNKSDREGAARTEAELAMMLDLTSLKGWRPPIVRTVAPSGGGVADAVAAFASHEAFLASEGEGPRRAERRARARLLALLDERFRRAVLSAAPESGGLGEAAARVAARSGRPLLGRLAALRSCRPRAKRSTVVGGAGPPTRRTTPNLKPEPPNARIPDRSHRCCSRLD